MNLCCKAASKVLPALVAMTTSSLIGCQSYEPMPIDPSAQREAFLLRSADSPTVAEFARALSEREGRSTATTFDLADGFSLAEAEAVALIYNAELRVARLEAGVLKAQADHAGLWEDPVLGTDFARIIESTEHPWKAFGSLGFTIPISGRLGIEVKRASTAHAAELYRVAQLEWHTRMELRRAWAEWTAARDRLALMQTFMDRLDQLVGIVDGLDKAGELPRIESRLFRVERASRQSELKRMESMARENTLAIHQWMGLAPESSVDLVPGVPGILAIDPARFASESSSFDAVITNSIQLAAIRADYEVAEKSLQLEIRKQFPDVTVGPGLGREDGENQVTLGISLPLPILNRNQQAIAMMRAERDVAMAKYDAAAEQLASDLSRASERLRAVRDQRTVMEQEIVPLVDQQLADARKLAELGEVKTWIQLETLQSQQQAKLNLIETTLEQWLAMIEMEELSGPAPADAASSAQPEEMP